MDNNQWTMNCVIFGAELFKLLSTGQISKTDAIARIKKLTSEINDETAIYLLKRVNELVY